MIFTLLRRLVGTRTRRWPQTNFYGGNKHEKKIIATVLAMVMALALYHRFRGHPLWTENGSTANVDLFDGKLNTKTTSGSADFPRCRGSTVDSKTMLCCWRDNHLPPLLPRPGFCHRRYPEVHSGQPASPLMPCFLTYVLVKTAGNAIAVGTAAANLERCQPDLIMKKVSAVV